MARRNRLCPEITDPGLRSFLDMLPAIRSFNEEVLSGIPIKGQKLVVPSEDREVTVFWHKASGSSRPVVFEFHGGGFMMGNAEKDDALCRRISRMLDCHVIGVNYSLAPENPYPAAVNDAYNVVKYFHDHASEYGIDPEKMAVYGYSAGATLATVTAMRAVEAKEFTLCAQVLHYPYLDAVHLPAEKKHYDCDMDNEVMRAFTILYSKEEERSLPYVSPVCAEIDALRGAAPACILPVERDSLKEEGLRYAEMLKEAGVPVYCKVVPDAHHGYVEDAGNEGAYMTTMEDARKTHSRYFRDWAKAAMEISFTFLSDRFNGEA